MSLKPPILIWCAALALLILVPPFLGTYEIYLLNLVLTNVILATGLNLLTGNAGQISLCQSSFMAIGAYGTALVAAGTGAPMWVGLVGGGLLAAAGGCLIAIPAMRLSGFYLALATLGFLEITQILIEQLGAWTGGVRGLMVPKPSLLGIALDTDIRLYCLILPITVALLLLARNILRSRIGRSFDAIRTAPAAAQALGISLARTKLIAFAISALYAGIAGGLGAMVVGLIDPTEYGAAASLRAITFIVVGGMGSLAGSVIGAAVLTLLPEVLRGAHEFSDLIFAALLLGFLILVPGGLAGILTRWRRPTTAPRVPEPAEATP